MHELQRYWVALVAMLLLAVGSVGCGEEVDQENGGANGSADADSDGDVDADSDGDADVDGDGEAECGEGEELNPFTGECVPVSDDGDGDVDGDADGDVDADADADADADVDGEVDADGDGPVDCGFGAIQGQACGTNGSRLPAAQVVVSGEDCDGVPFELMAETDASGTFFMDDVPAGHHELLLSSGSFQAERFVNVSGGETNTSMMSEAEKLCLSNDVNILVVTGSFDNISDLLDSLDLTYDTSSTASDLAATLSDMSQLLQYDIIFFPCGSRFTGLTGDTTMMMNNLRAFVQQGNSIYASDWSHGFVQETFPDAMTFASPNPRIGDSQTFPEARVVSTPMQILLGQPTVELVYNLSGVGQVIEAFPPSVVHFRDDVGTTEGVLNDVPLMTSYTDPIGGGNVVYTSFHNSAQANSDMLDILSFMIFNL